MAVRLRLQEESVSAASGRGAMTEDDWTAEPLGEWAGPDVANARGHLASATEAVAESKGAGRTEIPTAVIRLLDVVWQGGELDC